jgi:GNAT superfamily N-acetyltransferase
MMVMRRYFGLTLRCTGLRFRFAAELYVRHHEPHMIHIRPFVPQDATAVAEVILPIQRNEFEIPITLEAQPDLADVPGFYQQGSGNFWIAEVSQTVVGTIGLLDIGAQQAALRKMFVAAPYRGKEHGVAQLLLRELLAWSESRHLETIYLGTTDKFLAAHRAVGWGELANPNASGGWCWGSCRHPNLPR